MLWYLTANGLRRKAFLREVVEKWAFYEEMEFKARVQLVKSP